MRADSCCYTHSMVATCRDKMVGYFITVCQHSQQRDLIDAIPEADWTPIPYWMEGGSDVAETTYTPVAGKADSVPVRLIVGWDFLPPCSRLALFTTALKGLSAYVHT